MPGASLGTTEASRGLPPPPPPRPGRSRELSIHHQRDQTLLVAGRGYHIHHPVAPVVLAPYTPTRRPGAVRASVRVGARGQSRVSRLGTPRVPSHSAISLPRRKFVQKDPRIGSRCPCMPIRPLVSHLAVNTQLPRLSTLGRAAAGAVIQPASDPRLRYRQVLMLSESNLSFISGYRKDDAGPR